MAELLGVEAMLEHSGLAARPRPAHQLRAALPSQVDSGSHGLSQLTAATIL